MFHVRLAKGPEGAWVVVLEIESEQCRIGDLLSGESRWIRQEAVAIVDGVPLRAIGAAVPDAARQMEAAIRSDRELGLVLVVGTVGQVSVRALLDATSACESDLNGLLAELEAGDVLERTDVAGGRGYGLTEQAMKSLETLRSSAS